MAVRFCVIGWLNVSVKPCVFCSSVFFCEKKKTLESRCGDFSLTELTDLTELSTSVSIPQNAFGIQISQNVTAKDRCWMLSVRCWWLAKERHQSESIFPSRHKQRRRGISVITPLSIRRGAGGEASLGCKVLCYRLTWCLCGPLCVLFFCVTLWEIERTLLIR